MSPLLITAIFILLIHQQSTLVKTSSSKVPEAQDHNTRDLKASFQTKPKLLGSKEPDLSFEEAQLEFPRLFLDSFDATSFRIMRRLKDSIKKRQIRSNLVYFLASKEILTKLYESFDTAHQVVEHLDKSAPRKARLDRASRLFWEFYALSKAKLDTFKAELKAEYPPGSSIYKKPVLPKQGRFVPRDLDGIVLGVTSNWEVEISSARTLEELETILGQIIQTTELYIAQARGIWDDDRPKKKNYLKKAAKVAKVFTCGALLYGVYNMASHIMEKYGPNSSIPDSTTNLWKTTNQNLKDGNNNIIITTVAILLAFSILGLCIVLWYLRAKNAKAKIGQSEKSASSATTSATTGATP